MQAVQIKLLINDNIILSSKSLQLTFLHLDKLDKFAYSEHIIADTTLSKH